MNAAFYYWLATRLRSWRRVLLVAAVAGIPLGIVAGRWAWVGLAGSLGVVPVTVIPGPALLAGLAALLLAGNLLTAAPASVAARTRPAAVGCTTEL